MLFSIEEAYHDMELLQEVDLFARKALEISGAGGNGKGVVSSC
jgi:hypothetical protein